MGGKKTHGNPFSDKTRDMLLNFYNKNAYPSLQERRKLSQLTGEIETRISTWFKTKRQRDIKNDLPIAGSSRNKRRQRRSPNNPPKKRKCTMQDPPELESTKTSSRKSDSHDSMMYIRNKDVVEDSSSNVDEPPYLTSFKTDGESTCSSHSSDWFLGCGRDEVGENSQSSMHSSQKAAGNGDCLAVDLPTQSRQTPSNNIPLSKCSDQGENLCNPSTVVSHISRYYQPAGNQQDLTIVQQQYMSPYPGYYPYRYGYPTPWSPALSYLPPPPSWCTAFGYSPYFGFQHPTINPYTGMPEGSEGRWPSSWWPVLPRGHSGHNIPIPSAMDYSMIQQCHNTLRRPQPFNYDNSVVSQNSFNQANTNVSSQCSAFQTSQPMQTSPDKYQRTEDSVSNNALQQATPPNRENNVNTKLPDFATAFSHQLNGSRESSDFQNSGISAELNKGWNNVNMKQQIESRQQHENKDDSSVINKDVGSSQQQQSNNTQMQYSNNQYNTFTYDQHWSKDSGNCGYYGNNSIGGNYSGQNSNLYPSSRQQNIGNTSTYVSNGYRTNQQFSNASCSDSYQGQNTPRPIVNNQNLCSNQQYNAGQDHSTNQNLSSNQQYNNGQGHSNNQNFCSNQQYNNGQGHNNSYLWNMDNGMNYYSQLVGNTQGLYDNNQNYSNGCDGQIQNSTYLF